MHSHTLTTHAHPHTRMHTLTHACTPSHTHAHPHLHMHTLTHACTPSHTHAHPHTPMHTLTHACTPSHTHAHPHLHMHTLTHACTPSHTHAHPHTHACTPSHTHAHPHTHACTPSHTHAHPHTCTHAQTYITHKHRRTNKKAVQVTCQMTSIPVQTMTIMKCGLRGGENNRRNGGKRSQHLLQSSTKSNLDWISSSPQGQERQAQSENRSYCLDSSEHTKHVWL